MGKIALRRLSAIFDNKQGILTTKNIDIGKDRFGRDIIKYNTKESFGQRVNKRIEMDQSIEKANSNDSLGNNQNSKFYNNLIDSESLTFRNSLIQNVNRDGIEERAQRVLKQKQVISQEEEKQI